MPDPTTRWFRLHDHVGVDAAGNLEPLSPTTSFTFPKRTALGVIQDKANATVLPDTRVLSTDDPLVAAACLACGLYEEIKPPTAKQKQALVEETATNRERNAKRLAHFEKHADPDTVPGEPDNLTTLVETED